MWMVRIKIRLVRLVHHLAAHYTVSVAMHMILSTDLDTSLVKDRRETEKILTVARFALPRARRGAGGEVVRRWRRGGAAHTPENQ